MALNWKIQELLQSLYESGCSLLAEGKRDEAVKKWKEAAENGHAEAQKMLDDLLIQENVLPVNSQSYIQNLYENACELWAAGKNAEAAQKWLEAAENGHAEAQCMIGDLYEHGDVPSVIPKSFEKALEWYKKSADQGSAGGCRSLANIYKKSGREAEAIRLYEAAAGKNDWISQLSLGIHYHTKKPNETDSSATVKNLKRAVYWYKIVISSGLAPEEHLAEARAKLTLAEKEIRAMENIIKTVEVIQGRPASEEIDNDLVGTWHVMYPERTSISTPVTWRVMIERCFYEDGSCSYTNFDSGVKTNNRYRTSNGYIYIGAQGNTAEYKYSIDGDNLNITPLVNGVLRSDGALRFKKK